MVKKGLWINEKTFIQFSDKTTSSLSAEIATRQRSIDFYSLGMCLPNPDPVLKKMGKDIAVYNELLSDGHLGGCVTSRKSGVKSLEWEIDRGKAKSRQAKLITDLFKNLDIDRILGELLNAPLFGYQVMEVIWEKVGNYILPKDIVGKPQRWFVFDENNELRLRTKENMMQGEQLPPKKFLLATHEATYENPYGFPELSRCFWPLTFKKGGYKFWVTFAEKYGMPWPVGKLPRGLDQKEYNAFADILQNMVQDGIAVIPDDGSVDLLVAQGKGATGSIYKDLIETCKVEVSISILGQNLTTEVKGGSYAAAESLMQVRKDIRDSDKKISVRRLNKVIAWISELNFASGDMCAFSMYEEEDVDETLAVRDELLSRAGVRLTPKYYQREYGFEEGDIASVGSPQPQQFGSYEVRKFGGLKKNDECTCGCHDFAEGDWVEKYIERLAPSLQSVRQSALDEIEKWLRSLDSPPSEAIFITKLHDILGDAYDKLDKAVIALAVKDMYTAFKLTDLAPGMEIAFGGADLRTIEFLSNLDSFYLSKFVKNPDVVSQLNDLIKNLYLEQGEGLFGRGDKAIQELKNFLSQKMIDLQDYQVQRIVDTAVQRSRNWAHISQLNDAGIAEIEIYEPTQECDFCKAMNGKIIKVETAYKKMNDIASMSPEEYESFLKSEKNSPMLDNIESLVDRGMLPPYHPHCHGRIIKRVK